MPLIYHAITDKGIGGAGLFLLRLLTHTDKERFPSRVLLPKGSALIPLFDRYSIPTISLSEAKEASFSFPFFMALCRYLRRYPPDLLHAHGALSAKLSARLTTSAPILATRHCDTPFPLQLSLYPFTAA